MRALLQEARRQDGNAVAVASDNDKTLRQLALRAEPMNQRCGRTVVTHRHAATALRYAPAACSVRWDANSGDMLAWRRERRTNKRATWRGAR